MINKVYPKLKVIEEVGNNVRNLKKGDRVIVAFLVACGHCFYCEHHEYSQCDNTNDYGEEGAYIKEITSGGADCVIDCVGLDGKMSLLEI